MAVTVQSVGRPVMPEGYGVPETDEGLLEWPAVRARLEQAQHYWIASATLDGRPHAVPLWAAWVDDQLFFDGAPTTRWARNMTANPRAVVHLESGSEVVIVEGTFLLDSALAEEPFQRVRAQYLAKYKTYQPERADGLYRIVPHKAMAWTAFPKDVTRFTFGGR